MLQFLGRVAAENAVFKVTFVQTFEPRGISPRAQYAVYRTFMPNQALSAKAAFASGVVGTRGDCSSWCCSTIFFLFDGSLIFARLL